MISESKTNEIVGTIITLEKYRFAGPSDLIADVVRETVKLINQEKK